MARRCGCASDSCSCIVVAGDGMAVTGSGSERNPYVVTSLVANIETGIDVQSNSTNIILDAHQLDFRGSAVTVTPGADKAVVTVTVPDPVTGAIIPPGTIWMFGSTDAPAGWLMCDGAELQISAYGNLFAAIGTNFGGDGITTFNVPNMMDRFPIGASGSRPINGEPGGDTTTGIAVANLPPHTHGINHNHGPKNTASAGNHMHELEMSGGTGSGSTVRRGTSEMSPGVGAIHSNGAHVHSLDLGNYIGDTSSTQGASGTPLDIMPPWHALAFIIKST